jgi:hypothetical protein
MTNKMRGFLRRRAIDGLFFLVLTAALGGFALVALHLNPANPSYADHFILQAQAWLNGRLDIGVNVNDAILVGGKLYIIYPPLPALLMLPFVAVLGHRFSDIWFTWAFGALNIIVLFRTLEVMRVRALTQRTPLENGILAITFGFGTIALWLCLGGAVWYTAQVVSVFGIMITLHGTLTKRWPLAALGVGMVLLTRTSEVLIGIVPLIVYLEDLGVGRRLRDKALLLPNRWPSWGEVVTTLAPFGVAALILLAHNRLYFGNPLSSGYDIHNAQDTAHFQYGVLSWHYLWPNVVVDFLRWPAFAFHGISDPHPRADLILDRVGTSAFFSTPLLLIFLVAPQGKALCPPLRRILWVAVAMLLLPILGFQAAGGDQVGARYLFPLYPVLFILLAQRAGPLDARWIGLAGAGVFINLLLARTFWYAPPSNAVVVGSAGIAVAGCVSALVLLRRQQRRRTAEAAPPAPATRPAEADAGESAAANLIGT